MNADLPSMPVRDAGTLFLQRMVCHGPWLKLERSGEVGPHVYVHGWYDPADDDGENAMLSETDTLEIINDHNAYAERTNANGDVVWRATRASLDDIISQLKALPAPGQPGAPTEVLSQITPDRPQ